MKRILFLLSMAGLVLLSASCTSMKIATHHQEGIDFSEYKTYRFVRPGGKGQKKSGYHHFVTREVLFEIRPVLEAKGFQEVKSRDEADLLVHFYTFTQNKRHISPPSYRVGRWGRTWVARPGQVHHYKEGTLGIDIVDGKKKELVWQGIGRDVLDRDDPAGNFAEAAVKILDTFPPLKE